MLRLGNDKLPFMKITNKINTYKAAINYGVNLIHTLPL